jgi:hypothetical protein
MGVLEKIKEIEAEMARTQKNKVRHNFAFSVHRFKDFSLLLLLTSLATHTYPVYICVTLRYRLQTIIWVR